jgi:alcohol dehydrogenase
MLSDILPTGFECGVLNGKVQPGGSVAIVGSGPIGLAALLTAQFYSPADIIMIDLDDNRLEVAQRFGATAGVNSADGAAVAKVMKMTGGVGVDTAIEALGIPATFELCQKIVAPGGVIANIGVHGTKVDLHLETLWDRNITINHAPGRHREHAHAAQKPWVEEDRPQAADHASLQTRADPRRL